MASSRPVFRFYVDWDNNGNFTGTNDEVTSTSGGNALAADGMTIAYGRDQARAFSPVRSGEAAFKLNNAARIYSPENSGSPLFGQLVPGRPVQITATQDAATTVIYRGFLDDFTVSPNKGDRTVTLSCLDMMARFAQANPISTPLYPSIRTGTAIGYILDALGWPSGARDLDPGASTIRWWWEEGTDGLTALSRMLAAEGPPAHLLRRHERELRVPGPAPPAPGRRVDRRAGDVHQRHVRGDGHHGHVQPAHDL